MFNVTLTTICFLLIASIGTIFAQEAETDSTQTEFEKSLQNSKRIIQGISFKDGKEEVLKHQIEDIDLCVGIIRSQIFTLYTILVLDSRSKDAEDRKDALIKDFICDQESTVYSSVKELEETLLRLEKHPGYSEMFNALKECSDKLHECVMGLNSVLEKRGYSRPKP